MLEYDVHKFLLTMPLPTYSYPEGHPLYRIARREPNLTGHSGCWVVTLTRFSQTIRAFFYDRAYASPDQACQAAQAFRDELLKRLPPRNNAIWGNKPGSHPGVCRQDRGQKSAQWYATIGTEGRTLVKNFSCAKYGEEQAFQLALAQRRAWEQQYHVGLNVNTMPTADEIKALEQEIRARFNEQPIVNEFVTHFNSKQMYGLYRIEATADGKGGAWRVRIVRNKTDYGKGFHDSVYGSSEQAFAAACRYRDEIVATVAPATMREMREKLRRNNTSGVPGVFLTTERRTGAQYWVAAAKVGEKKFSRRFNIKTYGYQRAFNLAKQARQQFLDLAGADDQYWLMSPAAREIHRTAGEKNAAPRRKKAGHDGKPSSKKVSDPSR